MPLILASTSPRRADLLARHGYEFQVVTADVEENAPQSLGPQRMVEENARQKVAAVVPITQLDDVIVGADTLVFLGTEALGKPHTHERAREMLRSLSGRINTVCTGVAVVARGEITTFSVSSAVKFRDLSDADIDNYMSRVDVLDKAGAYAAQSHAEIIIEHVEGDLNSVIGLPVTELAKVLARSGIVPKAAS